MSKAITEGLKILYNSS